MFEKARSGRDAFTFSLRGMTATASYFITPVIDDDSINRVWADKLADAANDQSSSPPEQAEMELGLARPHLT
jgi:hypothetical protein